ncbi:MAG: DUF11 domain-containing protein [Acidimicrobiia bacterium]
MRLAVVTALLIGAAFIPGVNTPVAADDAPDGSRSTITQQVVHREALPGGGWEITIEASLDSNAVCHILLFQCVVEPAPSSATLTLQSVECLSPGWLNIDAVLPIVGTVNVCARFDAERAGRDQRFRFVYTTPLDVGSVSETVRFFRFPEEILFIRAQHTLVIDLAADADVSQVCPDTAAIGTTVECTVTVEAHSAVPNASVDLTPPAQFTSFALTPDASPGNWDCTAGTSCEYVAGGGTLPLGSYTFTASAAVVAPPADVQQCAAVASDGTELNSSCADVRVYEDDTDTTLDIEKTSAPDATVGGPVTYTITVNNTGPHDATNVVVTDAVPALLRDAVLTKASGAGTFTCVQGPVLTCSAPLLPAGASATFVLQATVRSTAVGGQIIVNEVAATWANNPFGPDVAARDGNEVTVVAAVVIPPRFTG